MNTSRSFDRAADSYDNTRPLFDATAEVGIQSLLDAAVEGARFLEVGTGTGRISIPLLERGADLIGCDLSEKMLMRQREKYPAARLVESDAVFLPFASGHFDAVLTVHVMHLIGPWREALREFKRVLKAGGVLLNVTTYAAVGESIRDTMRGHWRSWLKAHAVDTHHPGAQNKEERHAELLSMGARLQELEVIRFALPFTLRVELERYSGRVSSDTWSVPEEIFQESLTDLQSWVEHEYGDLDQGREDKVRFVFDIASFDA